MKKRKKKSKGQSWFPYLVWTSERNLTCLLQKFQSHRCPTDPWEFSCLDKTAKKIYHNLLPKTKKASANGIIAQKNYRDPTNEIKKASTQGGWVKHCTPEYNYFY